MWIFDMELDTPDAFNSHSITMMATNTFKIFLVFPPMGMYVLMSHITAPIMTRVKRIENSDMIVPPLLLKR
jgi:hypothetical protein